MIYGSVCSGIEAATVAWHPLGWQPAFFAEIDKFPSSLLKHHYPEIPNHGDFTTINGDSIELLVGGTPCQDFSVAGLRAGMDGARGQLTVEFAHLAGRLRPRWLVWENVPGVLSIDGGRAFGTFLGLLGQLGYGVAYRVLDAQHFGVPQRRRRVFVVGHLGDWRRAAAVLFERHSLSGHPSPRREKGKGFTHELAPSLTGSGRGTERTGESRGQDPVGPLMANTHPGSYCGQDAYTGHLVTALLIPVGVTIHGTDKTASVASYTNVAGALRARTPGSQENSSTTAVMTLAIRGRDGEPTMEVREDGTANAVLTPNGGRGGIGVGAVAISANQRGELRERPVHGSLNGTKSGKQFDGVVQGMAVRRLTPRECERLQGFPDDYTKISDKTADGPRYKALGNSMAVPVMRWIGERIALVDKL